MNAPSRRSDIRRATQAAEGLDRMHWTNADIWKLVEAGVLPEGAPIELIKGELAPMAAERSRHAKLRMRMVKRFMEAAPSHLFVASGVSLFLADDVEIQPDLHIIPESMATEDARGPDVVIAIEIAASTQHRDRTVKPPLYAEGGVGEVWVIDLDRSETLVLREPAALGYRAATLHPFDEALTPLGLPALSFRVADHLG